MLMITMCIIIVMLAGWIIYSSIMWDRHTQKLAEYILAKSVVKITSKEEQIQKEKEQQK